jgi:hydroxyacylglutathione hydrolase
VRTRVGTLSLLFVASLALAVAPMVAQQAPAPAPAPLGPMPAGAAQAAPPQPLSAFIEPGVLPKSWLTAGPRCMEVPAFQVHEYNPNFFIIRQSGCIHYEKPFMFLIFGRDKALLEDTGAGDVSAVTAPMVMDLVAKWQKRNNKTTPIELIVTHSHSHGDHTAGDAGFKTLPNVKFVEASVTELQKAFAIKTWPTDIASLDLGKRIIDIIPIPGHDVAGIAIYDRQTGVLLTGDSFYPGRLYVGQDQFATFAASHQRLVDFTKDKPVAHIFGTHIEQTSTPFVDYPRGTVYQPDEHTLELTRGVLLELNEAIVRLNGTLDRVVLRDVILSPRIPRQS